MQRFKKILYVDNGGAAKKAALERALTLAKRNLAELTVVGILEGGSPGVTQDQRAKADRSAGDGHPGAKGTVGKSSRPSQAGGHETDQQHPYWVTIPGNSSGGVAKSP